MKKSFLTKTKKTKGFSYIEVILALALFAIAMLAIIPTLTQAGRNLAFAEEAYNGHLQAQRIMLAARAALMNGTCPEAAVRYIAAGWEFSVWVEGRNKQDFHSTNNPGATLSFNSINLAAPDRASTIIAVVWGENGQAAGRAIGMVY